jgi:multidrug efflux pump
MVAVLLVGCVAYLQLPVSALPEVNYPTIQVQTLYPGASAAVMASTVTGPLEKQLGQIPGLSQMTSTSSGGASVIVLQFVLNEDIDVAEQEVQAALNSANAYLPNDLPTPPIYSKTNPADAPVLTLALSSKSLSLSKVQDLADTRLAPKISQLSGVGLVTIQGGQKPAIRIQANPAALASYGLSLDQIRSAISSTSVNGAKGTLNGPQQSYTLDANDQLSTGDAYKQVVLAYKNGSPIMLTDVAQISDGVENSKLAAWMNQTPAIIVNVQRQSTANTIKVVDEITAVLPQLESSLPASVKVNVLTDRTITIRASVQDVEFELALTIGLVVMVIFLFLRSWRATIIPSVAVPLSLIGTFAVMYLRDFSLNNLTLMAFTIATGFVVDDAIVMIENISRFLEEGMPPMEAALKGSGEIGFTIVSLTLSLVAVLIPLLFMGDITGRLFREFAITLAVTILISASVSLTLTPMMCSRLLRYTPPSEQGAIYRWSERCFNSIISFYGRTLGWVLNRQGLMLFVALTTVVTVGLLYVYIPKGFFPIQDTGLLQVITQAPEATSFDAMAQRQQTLARVALADPAVESLSSFIGIDGTNITLNSGRMQINLKPLEQRDSALVVMRRLRTSMNNITGIKAYLQPVQDLTVEDRVSRTQFQYTIQDTDENELDTWTTKIVDKLRTLPQLEDVVTDQMPNGNTVNVQIDRETASRMGISPQNIDDALYDAFGQRQVSTLYTQTNLYHVILEATPTYQTSADRLGDIYLQAQGSSSSSSAGGGGGGSGGSLLTASSTSGVGSTPAGGVQARASGAVSSASGGRSSPSGSVLQSGGGVTTAVGGGGSSSRTAAGGGSSGGGGSGSSASSTSTATAVPLSAFTTISTALAPLTINHQAQFPVVTVSFNLSGDTHLSQAVTAVDKAVSSLKVPASVQTRFQGTAASYANSLNNEGLLLLAAMLTVYIVLGVLYESFIHPLTILSTLPSAGVGALLALWVLGQDLGIVGIIGIILLIGIVQKNGILMVDFALEAERDEGLPPREAIYNASLLRFRPIIMTTLAALFGGLPLAMGRGIGAELRRPLGIAMVGGLLVSQALTLYTTPIIYIWFDRLGRRFRRVAAPEAEMVMAGGTER